MLPKVHRQVYESALNALLNLQERVSARNPDIAALEEALAQVQKIYQDDLMALTSEELDTLIIPRWQSIQTETQRNLRLLGTDILFLRSSRQAATSQKRLKQISNRLSQLIGFCQVMLGSDNNNS